MQIGNVTTPFGRRAMSLALVKQQMEAAEIPTGKSVDKWKVFRDACDARTRLGLRDRAFAVLNALLTFYPDGELSEEGNLIVFPSNAQLAARANGIAGTTLRENLALLVDRGLITRKDSPNGKRYARRSGSGELQDAFGFNLAPLLARAEELALLAQEVAAERREIQILRERITILRRDIRKLVSAAVEEGAEGNWEMVEAQYISMVSGISKAKSADELRMTADDLRLLHQEVLNILEIQLKTQKNDGNGDEIRQHIQNSNTESSNESEPSFEMKQDEPPAQKTLPISEPQKPFPLGMVVRACPDIADYGPGGAIGSWRDLMSAAVVVRSMLGVSPSAYQEACEVMGPENAATAIACILERAGQINSAGGYLRDLTRKAARGEFSLGPMLMALMRANAGRDRQSA